MELDLIQWFMLGFFIFLMYKLYESRGVKKMTRKNRGVFWTIPMILTLAFAVPYFTKNLYQVFFPPRAVGLPIWVWIVLGVLVLVVVKVVLDGGRQQPIILRQ